jgi:elongation factor 1-gamma
MAIAKYLAHGHASLLGSSDLERAQVDQWTNFALELSAATNKLVSCVLGTTPLEKAAFDDALKTAKEQIRGINTGLSGDWLVGGKMTLADVMVAASLTFTLQLVLDEGFRKPSGNVFAWYERVAGTKEFSSVFGRSRIASKGLKPVLKDAAAEPKKKEKQ